MSKNCVYKPGKTHFMEMGDWLILRGWVGEGGSTAAMEFISTYVSETGGVEPKISLGNIQSIQELHDFVEGLLAEVAAEKLRKGS